MAWSDLTQQEQEVYTTDIFPSIGLPLQQGIIEYNNLST